MKIKKLVLAPLGIAGMSVGMGMIGEQLGSEGLEQGGEVAGKFIKPAIAISMGGILVKQLKELKKDKKKDRLGL